MSVARSAKEIALAQEREFKLPYSIGIPVVALGEYRGNVVMWSSAENAIAYDVKLDGGEVLRSLPEADVRIDLMRIATTGRRAV